jgi:hypothetical protein
MVALGVVAARWVYRDRSIFGDLPIICVDRAPNAAAARGFYEGARRPLCHPNARPFTNSESTKKAANAFTRWN